MKLWRLGKDDTLNTTETRAVLAVKLTIYTFIFLGASATASAIVGVATKGTRTINPGEFWLYVLGMVLSFLATLHGLAWVGGWTKQKESVKVAQADAVREETKAKIATSELPAVTSPKVSAPKTLVDAVIPSEAPSPMPPEARDDVSEDEIP